MKILSIETSCDETSIAIIEKIKDKEYKVLAHETISQANLHKDFGGVYPTLSRREHEKNLIPLLHRSLEKAKLINAFDIAHSNIIEMIGPDMELLERYPDLKENVMDFFTKYKVSKIDFIAVTNGPGLPPALWVGVNFSKILSILLGSSTNKIPIYPINHMEGHIVGAISELTGDKVNIKDVKYPVLNLLISGGHTELVISDKSLSFQKIGQTQDDAVGECFDKVARMLDLPYPGGPEIGKLALKGRENAYVGKLSFPRPMEHSKNLDFSFSGLKTHILYFIQNLKNEGRTLDDDMKISIATEFEEAVRDVLIKKTKKAIEEFAVQTLIVGGGVSASPFLKNAFINLGEEEQIEVLVSSKDLATDNALMIALTCANQIENGVNATKDFVAVGSKNYEWK